MLYQVNWYTDTHILKQLVLLDVMCQCVSGVRCSTDMLRTAHRTRHDNPEEKKAESSDTTFI